MPALPDPPTPRNTLYSRQTRSGRRLTQWRRLLYRAAVPVALLLIRFWWLTCRVVRVVGAEHVVAGLDGGPMIPVYWHQHQLFCVRYLLRNRARGLQLGFLISPSVDGEIPAMIAHRYGVRVLRGSSSDTGARTLRDYYVALREGTSAAITPDGPYGPRYVFKPGPILLSQLSGRPIVALAFHASRAWRFRAWDHFILPWPFARIVIAVGAPRYVPKGLDAAGLERWQQDMAAELRAVYRTAREASAAG